MSDTALVPVDAVTDALPVVSGAEMTRAFAAYRELQAALDAAMPDQIMSIEGRPFRKKGYWRAVAVAFHLNVEPIEEQRTEAGVFSDGQPNFGYHVTCRASTRTGRASVGDGTCFAIDKAARFKCPHPEREGSTRSLHYPHETCPDYDPVYRWRELPAQATEHNVRSHAHTRAFNRAVSNLVGFGEVSAEEVDRDDRDQSHGPRTARAAGGGKISDPQRKRLWAIARTAGWTDTEVKAHLQRHGFEHTEDVTRDKYEAICTELERGVDGTREASR